jgi:hypothetical protein
MSHGKTLEIFRILVVVINYDVTSSDRTRLARMQTRGRVARYRRGR